VSTRAATLPSEVDPRKLRRRALTVVGLIGALILVVALAPGLGEVRDKLAGAQPGWLAVGVVLEALSCGSYVLMFRPVFCDRMSWRTSTEIGLSEVGVGSLVPASGAGGLALGAWVLTRSGMPAERIARRSVAFFVIKSSVNFVAVAVLGVAMALGAGPEQPLWLTALPAAGAVATIALVIVASRLQAPDEPPADAGRVRWLVTHARRALTLGSGEAVELVRRPAAVLVIGAIGYWFWDNAVLWATFHAFGVTLPVTVLLMGYLIGQLGGLLPLPGGVGGIDGGLIGTLIVYGAPAATTAAAVLAYRVILFWVPLLMAVPAFASLRRNLGREELCAG
jgi:uncharacterized membrane protein YbhN (UPF0104 family)